MLNLTQSFLRSASAGDERNGFVLVVSVPGEGPGSSIPWHSCCLGGLFEMLFLRLTTLFFLEVAVGEELAIYKSFAVPLAEGERTLPGLLC